VVFLGFFCAKTTFGSGPAEPSPIVFEGVEPVMLGLKTSINQATARELNAIPGMSTKQAHALHEYVAEVGPVCDVSALSVVKGIGPVTATKLSPYVLIEAPAATARPLNRWNTARLQEVPGVGPVLSERILKRRQAVGGFRCFDQVLAIQGIGYRLASELWRGG
jgi:DNA uptake protein ComE-like DNA-binding protein